MNAFHVSAWSIIKLKLKKKTCEREGSDPIWESVDIVNHSGLSERGKRLDLMHRKSAYNWMYSIKLSQLFVAFWCRCWQIKWRIKYSFTEHKMHFYGAHQHLFIWITWQHLPLCFRFALFLIIIPFFFLSVFVKRHQGIWTNIELITFNWTDHWFFISCLAVWLNTEHVLLVTKVLLPVYNRIQITNGDSDEDANYYSVIVVQNSKK